MASNEPNPLLTLELDDGLRDDADKAFALFLLFGLCPSVFIYLSYWLYGYAHVMEIMVGVNAFAGLIALYSVVGASRGSTHSIAIDRVSQTLTYRLGSSVRTHSIAGSTRIALHYEWHYRRRGRKYLAYCLLIEAEAPVLVHTSPHLLATRQVGQKIAEYLDLPFNDQTRDLTDQLLPRDVREKFGPTPRKRKQIFIPIQIGLSGLIILVLTASAVVGLGVYLTQLHCRDASLVVPLGSLALWILFLLLRERNNVQY